MQKQVYYKEIKMTNTQLHAKRELDILLKQTPDSVIRDFIPEILQICESFGKSGQSGGSYSFVANALAETIKKLCKQETISPLTGEDYEWYDVGSYGDDYTFQNARDSAVFKQGIDGEPYYINAIIWRGQYDWDKGTDRREDYYTGSAWLGNKIYRSRQFIKEVPFIPKKFYIDVEKEILPEDWTEEPFIEWDYTCEISGERKTEKYRNIIKDPKQLEEVFKYYKE